MAITCTIDATGIMVPTLADIRAYLAAQYQGIYGSDVNLDADTQDGQWIGILAASIHNANSMAVSVYNAFSPATAQGAGLSSVVKINGIARLVPTNSTAELLIGGTAGTIISGGYATDSAGVNWTLPATVTIPSAGQISVTATAATAGAISAVKGDISTIGTPTRGWQTVTNPAAASVGSPVETDAQLRVRQAASTAKPALTVSQGIIGDLVALTGIGRYRFYENDQGSTDANGIPGHCISVVIEGGDAVAIASAIALRKTPGVGTYGTAVQTITDGAGIARDIRFFRPTQIGIRYAVTLKALSGFTTDIETKVINSIVAWTNAFGIGEGLIRNRVYVPANLSGASESLTYEVVSIAVSRDGLTPTEADVPIAFNEVMYTEASYFSVTVTS